MSRSRLQALIRDGHVARAGATLGEANIRVNEGDIIEIAVPPPEPDTPLAQQIPLSIIHEDDDLIVIDKPAGMVVHPAAGNRDGTLVNALIAHCGDSLSGIGGVRRPGIVHRLDKETSGLLVVAKNDRAHQGLAAQFAAHGRDGSLERGYLALCWGVPRPRSGTIEAALDRSARDRLKRAVVASGGRHAVTHYRVEQAFDDLVSQVSCRLETGRTHQIRVHMDHIGHPLLGDPLYGKGFRSRAARLPEPAQIALAALGRQALHAEILGFIHPVSGERLHFTSPPPPDLAALVDALKSL